MRNIGTQEKAQEQDIAAKFCVQWQEFVLYNVGTKEQPAKERRYFMIVIEAQDKVFKNDKAKCRAVLEYIKNNGAAVIISKQEHDELFKQLGAMREQSISEPLILENNSLKALAKAYEAKVQQLTHEKLNDTMLTELDWWKTHSTQQCRDLIQHLREYISKNAVGQALDDDGCVPTYQLLEKLDEVEENLLAYTPRLNEDRIEEVNYCMKLLQNAIVKDKDNKVVGVDYGTLILALQQHRDAMRRNI